MKTLETQINSNAITNEKVTELCELISKKMRKRRSKRAVKKLVVKK